MTPAKGFGSHPWGSAPCGFGTPASQETYKPAVFRDKNGYQADGPAIDPATGDYLLDDSGQKVGQWSVEHMVYLALRTQLGSSIVRGLGIALWPKTIDQTIQARAQSLVSAALKSLVDRRFVRIDFVKVERRGTNGVYVRVDWTDLTRQKRGSTEIPLVG